MNESKNQTTTEPAADERPPKTLIAVVSYLLVPVDFETAPQPDSEDPVHDVDSCDVSTPEGVAALAKALEGAAISPEVRDALATMRTVIEAHVRQHPETAGYLNPFGVVSSVPVPEELQGLPGVDKDGLASAIVGLGRSYRIT